MKISIITIVYNSLATIEEAIQSVISQKGDFELEYIVIDGGSSDGTLDIINKYRQSIAYFVSEKDAGIYDAMNKGLKKATGDIVGIVNSDDFLEENALDIIANFMNKNDCEWIWANMYLTNENGQKYARFFSPKILPPVTAQYMPVGHQTMFVRKSVYDQIGLFDTAYRLSADFELYCRLRVSNFKGLYMNEFVANFRDGGQSGGKRTFIETRDIVIKYGKNKLLANILFCKSMLFSYLGSAFPLWLVGLVRKIKGSQREHL